MAISGGAKFFTRNYALEATGGTITASTGTAVQDYAIDKNPLTFWTSVGSNDSTTETLTLVFASQTINRVILQNHNFKDFNIQYWNGSAYTHFSSVVGLDGSKANITETAFADDTAYYEVASVTTTRLRIQVLKSLVVDAQKFISQVIACYELGTLQGYPLVKGMKFSRNERIKQMLSGRVLVQKGIESFAVKLDFEKYPTSLSADLDLALTLHDANDPFLIWLCGGRRGSSYFRYTARGFRLRDVYCVQVTKAIGLDYYKSGYLNPVSLELQFEEHV